MTASALILAGGESQRLGVPKPLVELLGRPLIGRVADALSPLVDEVIVSVADAEVGRRIRSVLPRAVLVHDERCSRGPIEGFRQGFRRARGEVVLVAPCDAPLLRTQLYRLLRGALADYDAAVPKLAVLDPVRAVYRRSAVLRVLESSAIVPSPSALVDRLRSAFVREQEIRGVDAELSSFLDVNTRDDLRTAVESLRSGKLTSGPIG